MITCSTFTVGLCVWLVGRFRVGRFIRFIPHPVVAGFLAGTALLLWVSFELLKESLFDAWHRHG